MKRKGLYSIMKNTDTDLEDNRQTNLVFCASMNPSKTQEGKIYSDLCVGLGVMYNKGNTYIYVMCVWLQRDSDNSNE